MSDIKPVRKSVQYDTLSAEIDFKERTMSLLNRNTGETITIPSDAYGELQAILADVGRQVTARVNDVPRR
jgi:hypothetical protein